MRACERACVRARARECVGVRVKRQAGMLRIGRLLRDEGCTSRNFAERGNRGLTLPSVFIIAVHRAFVLGLGARHRGIVDLSDSEGVIRCVTVFACYSSSSSALGYDQVIRENPASRGTETSAEVLVGPPLGAGGWSETPVNSSGTRLTLTLDGGLEGPPRPVMAPYPFPSASSVGVGRRRGSAWVRQFSPP